MHKGYYINSLGSLAVEGGINFYIFVIADGFEDPRLNKLQKEFFHIADRIGDQSVIVRGPDEAFLSEVCQKYLHKDFREVLELIPALLLTDTHPDKIDDESLRLFVPLKRAEEVFGDLTIFFRALSEFAISKNTGFLERFDERPDWFSTANTILELKPGFFGISLNINKLIAAIRKKWA